MPQNYSGRVITILIVLFGSLAVIFSPVFEKLFHHNEQITQWVSLKPGIDMVGGTSLVYQIKVAPGRSTTPNWRRRLPRCSRSASIRTGS